MRQSQLFTKSLKQVPSDETSLNAQLLIQAGFIDKLFSGVYTLLPLGLRVIKKIENVIREEINNIDGQEVYMPALHPLQNYIQTGRQDIDVLFNTELKGGSKLVLGQSHEEVVVPLMQKHIHSYKDLPTKVYQFQTKFRNELRAKSGILRGREFMMKDLYSFHLDEEDLNEYYKLVQKAYFRIFKRCGILGSTYLTFASGGSFSQFSHEFQTLCVAGEDNIYVCDKCNLAINEEIIDVQSDCPNCKTKKLIKHKSIEVGNIFKLKNKFSASFDFQVTNQNGEQSDVIMGCYGIGLGRLMGTVVEISNDKEGIIWPKEIAPFNVHIILINQDNESVKVRGEEIYQNLLDMKIDVLYDDRLDSRPGEKFSLADKIGCTKRIIVSKKNIEKGLVEIKNRATGEVEFVNIDEIVQKLQL
ncbi:prolyl-tRNA synthetase [Patescibacteria group bacterium]|nr:prolyl-tRNA synthetase [Patescibacteria group bacterium]